MMSLFAPSPLARRIAESLDREAGQWRTDDRHVWTHRNGVSLWVANKDYGLGVSVGDNRRADPGDGRLPRRDRRHIWRSVNRIMDAQARIIRLRARVAFGIAGTV
jgi:hypothetical protein